MTADEGLAVLESILDSEYLSRTQVVIFRQAWIGAIVRGNCDRNWL